MPFLRLNFGRIPYLGLFCLVTDSVAVFPRNLKLDEEELEEKLGVPVIRAEVMGSSLLGVFLAGNSRALVAPSLMGEEEERSLREGGVEVYRIQGKFTALGNLLLVNDKGGLVSPALPARTVEELSSALGVPLERGTLSGLKTVGSAGVVTNRGALLHPDTTEEEMEKAREALGVPVSTGTACDGEKYVGICVAANSRGFLAGGPTTGAELGLIEKALHSPER
ncbi:MAG: translation initiation factor IF-6 [Candidatus Hadarchaeales archaeon]